MLVCPCQEFANQGAGKAVHTYVKSKEQTQSRGRVPAQSWNRNRKNLHIRYDTEMPKSPLSCRFCTDPEKYGGEVRKMKASRGGGEDGHCACKPVKMCTARHRAWYGLRPKGCRAHFAKRKTFPVQDNVRAGSHGSLRNNKTPQIKPTSLLSNSPHAAQGLPCSTKALNQKPEQNAGPRPPWPKAQQKTLLSFSIPLALRP